MDERRPGMRSAVRIVLGVTVLVAAVLGSTPAHGADRVRRSTLSTGVTYKATTIAGPNRIKIITIDPQSSATIDVATARNTLPGYAKTSSMATAHHALAAVNGDFGLSPGKPGHALAEDGNLLQTSPLGNDGKNFAIRADETKAFIGAPTITADVFRVNANKHIAVDLWNDASPKGTEVAGYSAYGGTVARPPGSACSARLLPNGGPGWATNKQGVQRTYTVDAVACGSAMPLNGGVVIATPSSGGRAAEVKALTKNETVHLSWSFGWSGVLDALGGSPVLLENGNVVVSTCGSYLCQRHPRTAVGIKANGDIMLFQVDGRSSASRGMTLMELAKEMQKRGAVWAMNLDGGGSSTMWVKGKGVVNVPSDGSERTVTSALLVLSGPDSGDPSGMLSGPVFEGAAASSPAAQDAQAALRTDFRAAVTDPGSTGGLLDALANGDLGSGRRVPTGTQDLLDAFRAANPAP